MTFEKISNMPNVNDLKKIYLFDLLDPAQLEKVQQIAKEIDVIAGDYVFDEGADAKSLFLIKHGSVEILKKSGNGNDASVAILSSGSHFGEMSLIDKMPRAAAAVAKENLKLIEIDFSAIDALCQADLKMGLKIYKAFASALCRRIRQTTGDLSSLKELKLRSV